MVDGIIAAPTEGAVQSTIRDAIPETAETTDYRSYLEETNGYKCGGWSHSSTPGPAATVPIAAPHCTEGGLYSSTYR